MFGKKVDSGETKYNVEFRLYDLYQRRIQHEDNLLHNRISWLIQVQGFLIAGFAAGVWSLVKNGEPKIVVFRDVSGDIKKILTLIAAFALFLAVVAFFNILGAVMAIMGIENRWSKMIDESYDPDNNRNTQDGENKLDNRILRDLPRLTNGLRKHRIEPITSAMGVLSACATPVACVTFWISVIVILYL